VSALRRQTAAVYKPFRISTHSFSGMVKPGYSSGGSTLLTELKSGGGSLCQTAVGMCLCTSQRSSSAAGGRSRLVNEFDSRWVNATAGRMGCMWSGSASPTAGTGAQNSHCKTHDTSCTIRLMGRGHPMRRYRRELRAFSLGVLIGLGILCIVVVVAAVSSPSFRRQITSPRATAASPSWPKASKPVAAHRE